MRLEYFDMIDRVMAINVDAKCYDGGRRCSAQRKGSTWEITGNDDSKRFYT